MYMHVCDCVHILIVTDLLTEGFTYHEKTPQISRKKINPVSGHSLVDAMFSLLSSQLANAVSRATTTESALASSNYCPSLVPVSLEMKLLGNWWNFRCNC